MRSWGELRAAAKNRGAQAAIAVVSRSEHAPVAEPFTVFDSLAVVVYDKDARDPAALRLALASAGWTVQRGARTEVESTDTAAIATAVEHARQALARRTTIRRAHSSAVKRIQEAAGEVDALNDEIGALLAQIEQAVR